eukprot:768405-Hanusia_phi.AAC.7
MQAEPAISTSRVNLVPFDMSGGRDPPPGSRPEGDCFNCQQESSAFHGHTCRRKGKFPCILPDTEGENCCKCVRNRDLLTWLFHLLDETERSEENLNFGICGARHQRTYFVLISRARKNHTRNGDGESETVIN